MSNVGQAIWPCSASRRPLDSPSGMTQGYPRCRGRLPGVILLRTLGRERPSLEQAHSGPIRLVVVLGHTATQERTRAMARRGLGLEVVRPAATDPGALHLLTENR